MSTTAEFDAIPQPPALPFDQCSSCKIGLDNCYYTANSVTLCPNCATAVEQGRAPVGSGFGRCAKALLLGGVAALAGAALHFAVLKLLNLNAALVTIFMGIMIGGAVRAGSGNRGGWRYQIIAVLLTYMAIAAAYVPLAISEIKDARDGKMPEAAASERVAGEAIHGAVPPIKAAPKMPRTPATLADLPLALILLVFAFFALPIVVGISSPISILIFGFGLFRAWAMNKATPVEVTGPHWRGA